MNATLTHGLTAAEVEERIRRGQVNRSRQSVIADYLDILRRNLLTVFNLIVVVAAAALWLLPDEGPDPDNWKAAIAVSAMAVINSLLGLVQEIRAKWHLDHLAILTETKARVWREGQLREVPATEVVLGDHLQLAAGDAIVADGEVLQASSLEVDEALLTGESDPVRRKEGERLLSGSFCIAGEGIYRATKVGDEAFAQSTSSAARRYRLQDSPLTRSINHLIEILTVVTVALAGLYFAIYWLRGSSFDDRALGELAQMIAATITSMVPQGLVLTATVAFTLGAVAMSLRGAIVQRLNAVESMASIDVVCTDKTGTLTTNRLQLERVVPLGGGTDEKEIRRRLQIFAWGSLDEGNKTVQTLRSAASSPLSHRSGGEGRSSSPRPGTPGRGAGGEGTAAHADGGGNSPDERPPLTPNPSPRSTGARGEAKVTPLPPGARGEVLDQLPFKSQNRYSAVRLRDGTVVRLLVLGASEALASRLHGEAGWQKKEAELQRAGLRVLLLAEADPGCAAELTLSEELPDVALQPIALVALSDELRPEARQTIVNLAKQGIGIKIISGDNPVTVKATVGAITPDLLKQDVVTGDQLASATPTDRAALIDNHSVFGRVAPQQKVEIVEALQARGRRVAMIGDGVNDVLSIKRSDLGIAMGEGSQASKTVAGLVLENNNFALLPETLEEGRTIVRNLRRSSKLFLVKNVYSLILILASTVGLTPFPYVPQQVTLLNWLVIGIPAFVIALTRERSRAAVKTNYLLEVGWFAVRTGVIFGVAGVVMLTLLQTAWLDADLSPAELVHTQRTMLLSMLIVLGITVLFRALDDGEPEPLKGDVRVQWLITLAAPTYLVAMYWSPAADFFKLTPLGLEQWWRVLLLAAPTWYLSKLSDQWGKGVGLKT